MAAPSSMIAFSASTRARATPVNTNFSTLHASAQTAMYTDSAATVTVTHIFSASQTFNAGLTATAVTCSAENAITFSHASAKIVPGAMSLLFRNNANSATNMSISDTGAVVVRDGLTVSAGTSALQAITGTTLVLSSTLAAGNTTITGTASVSSTLTAAGLTMSGASPKIIAGSSALLVRNSADSATIASFASSAIALAATAVTATVTDCTISGSYIIATWSSTAPSIVPVAGSNLHLGAPLAATTDTSRFLCVAAVAGTPTGIPSPITGGYVPIIMDSSNQRLCAYMGGAWVKVQFS